MFSKATATKTKTKPKQVQLIEHIDKAIYEIPDPPEIEIGDPLLNVLLTDAEQILKDDYVSDKVLEDKTIEQRKDAYNFDEIKDVFDEGQIPPQLEFFFGGENDNFVHACNFCRLTKTIIEFISFLCSDNEPLYTRGK